MRSSTNLSDGTFGAARPPAGGGRGWAPTIAVVAAAALAGAMVARRQRRQEGPHPAHPAFAPSAAAETGEARINVVRPAGPESMRDPDRRWDRTDEALDETFPASDPPATY